MVMTRSASLIASAALDDVSAPNALALATAASETSNATTFWPEPTRRPTMPAPIAPTPRKAMCDKCLPWFLELQQELIGVAADRRGEDQQRAVVRWIAQDVALADQP